jgi:hypothetical protein
MTVVLAIGALVVVRLLLRATTHYVVRADRLLIRRAGFIWMEILFGDVEEIECKTFFFDKFFQIRMYRLGFGKMLRITRSRKWNRYVLMNPRDPAPIIEAFRRFKGLPVRRSTPLPYPGPRRWFPDGMQ